MSLLKYTFICPIEKEVARTMLKKSTWFWCSNNDVKKKTGTNYVKLKTTLSVMNGNGGHYSREWQLFQVKCDFTLRIIIDRSRSWKSWM